jgi:hypothetical protein
MTKLASVLLVVFVIVVALAAVGPRIAQIINALVPLVLVVGIVAAVLRAVWFYTR